jgi:hypothetical protein
MAKKVPLVAAGPGTEQGMAPGVVQCDPPELVAAVTREREQTLVEVRCL